MDLYNIKLFQLTVFNKFVIYIDQTGVSAIVLLLYTARAWNPTPQNPTFRFPQTGFKRISASSSSSKLNWVGASI